MATEQDMLKQACYELARDTMWDTRPVDMEEIMKLSEALFKEAMDRFIADNDLGITIPLLTRSVHYLKQAHAIPPMRDDVGWFGHMLDAVLEVACPNAALTGEGRGFLKDMLHGISSFLDEDH